MKKYAIDYTKICAANNCFFCALQQLSDDCLDAARKSIEDGRQLLHDFLSQGNLIENPDLTDGFVRLSEAEAAVKEAENSHKKAIDSMVQMAKESNAAKTTLSSERRDGYIVETVIRKKGAVAYDEFSPEQTEFIRNIFTEELLVLGDPSNANCVHMGMLEVINVCQTKLEEPEYSSIEDFFIKNPVDV